MKLEKLFSGMSIGSVRLKNRLVVPAMSCSFCEPMDGHVTDRYIHYYEAKAKGGWGLLITEYTTVSPEGKAVLGQPGLWDDDQIEGHKRLTDAVHKYDTKIFAQLHHAGRETLPDLIGGQQTMTSSAMPSPMMPTMPREMTTEEVKQVINRFADAAVRAQKAGYDGVEIHGGHGYLLAQFLSGYVNKRTDEYGGSLRNRARIVTEIITQIKERCGKDFPVIFRISSNEYTPGGNSIEDTKVFAALAEEAGADAIDATVGSYYSIDTIIAYASQPHGWLTDYTNELKKVVDIPVIAVNRINDPLLAESILRSGKADAIAMGRGSLADPELPNKAKEGRFDEINTCVGCLQGCYGHFFKGLPTTCIFNPTIGREEEFAIHETDSPKKVMVVGGGPAGMEAAIVAAKRGNTVDLFEATDKLGGQLNLAAVPPYKGEFCTFLVWQKNQLEMNHVTVHTNTPVTKEVVEEFAPDEVIVATGATPSALPVPGADSEKVVTANDVLAGHVVCGQNVTIIGGGQVGAETANHLAAHNKTVTIVEMLPQIAAQEEASVSHQLMRDFEQYHVAINTETTVEEINETGVVIRKKDGTEQTVAADTVVIATGSKSNNSLSDELDGLGCHVTVVGDAKEVRNAENAILEGYEAGLAV